jgi:hypothetical protein
MTENKDILKETIISFETAVLAEKCEFPQIRLFDIRHHYNEYGHLNGTVLHAKEYIRDKNLRGRNCFMKSYVAPSQAMLQKWIRNKFKIFVTVVINPDLYKSKINYSADVLSLELEKEGLRLLDGFTIYQNYEEAFEEGLQETLKLILEKNEAK